MELRHYQEQALYEASQHFKAGQKRVIVCCPAGSGKTRIAAEAARRAVNKGSKVLWLAHRDELVDQGVRELFRMTGVRPGIIQASKKADAKSTIQVASIQTLARRDTMPPADIVIVDEAHHFLADSWAKVLSAYDGKFFLLLSATPARGDGRPMGDIADQIVAPIQPAQLISEGALVPCEIIAPSGTVQKGLAVDPVEAYVQWGKSKRAVVFAQTKEHAKQIRNGFIARDIAAAMVCDDTPSEQRKLIYKGVADGSIKVLVNVFIATEGLDIPSLEVCIIARTMGNLPMYLQCLDDKTEVLTQRGFLGVDEVTEDDMVAAMDVSDGSVHWKKILSKTDRPLAREERMFSISNPHLDIRVTGGHRMVYQDALVGFGKRRSWPESWSISTAEDLVEGHKYLRIPVAAEQQVEEANVSDAELRFIGWFLTDGTLSARGTQMFITQADHQPQIHDLRKCLNECGFTFSEYKRDPAKFKSFPNGKKQTIFSIPSGKMKKRLGKEVRGWWHLSRFIDKSFPEAFEELSSRQFAVLMEGIHGGDGTKRRTASWKPQTYSITTGNLESASRIQSLAVRRGFRCNLAEQKSYWMLHISHKSSWGMNVKAHDGRPVFAESAAVAGERVWCVENELGTLFIRRNGKVAVVGNCAGRVMRPSPGKGSGLLIDLKGLVEKYGSPENDRHYFLEGDEAVQMEMDEGQRRKMTCASCGSLRTGSVCPVCALATVSERSMLPEVEGVRLVAKVQLDRSDAAKHEYIRLVDEYRLARKQNFPARANEDFRARRGTRPDPTWLEEYGRYLNGHFRKNPLPAWWPDQVREPHLVHPANAEATPVAAE